MMRILVTLLTVLAATSWSHPGRCVDDAQRKLAVATTVERDAKKATFEQKTEALKKDIADLNAGFTEADTALKKVELDPSKFAEGAKLTDGTKAVLSDAKNALAKCTAPELEVAQVAAERKKAALKYRTCVDGALKPLDEKAVEDDLKKAGAPAETLVPTLTATREKLAQLVTRVDGVDELETDAAAAAAAWKSADEAAKKALADYQDDTKPADFLSERLAGARRLRCMTAYCFGGHGGSKYAVEPVLDLPVGLVWAMGGGALPSYINSHTVNVEFNAGLRFWLGYDIMSVMVYFSRPLIVGDDPIHVSGSNYPFPPSAVHRPFPSFGIGLAGDVLLLGVSYDELRNGATDATRDMSYPANYVLSRSITFSLGFSLFNAAKNAVGAANAKPAESSP